MSIYLYYSPFTSEYVPTDDEIALHIKLNTDEDITRFTDSISFNGEYGSSYYINIIGNKVNGYKAILED